MIEDSSGLSQAGLSRLNQSIEAFVYSILGAQVNVGCIYKCEICNKFTL